VPVVCGRGRLPIGMTVRANQSALVIRTCVGCREREVKSSLLRLVAVGDDILPDPQARLPGRGAYLHPRSPAWSSLDAPGVSRALRTADRSAWISSLSISSRSRASRDTCPKAGREADERSMSTRR